MRKFDNYITSFSALLEGVEDLKRFNRPVVRAGVIQQYEVTMELAWKTLKEYLTDQGYNDISSPRSVLKKAYSENLLQNENVWLAMLKARNDTSHIYNEGLSIKTCNQIQTDFIPAFAELQKTLKNLIP